MPQSKPKRNPEKNRANVARHRSKAMEALDHLLADVDIIPEKRDGKWFITWDMSAYTAGALELIAQAQGKTLDELMRAAPAPLYRRR